MTPEEVAAYLYDASVEAMKIRLACLAVGLMVGLVFFWLFAVSVL